MVRGGNRLTVLVGGARGRGAALPGQAGSASFPDHHCVEFFLNNSTQTPDIQQFHTDIPHSVEYLCGITCFVWNIEDRLAESGIFKTFVFCVEY